MKDAGDLKRFLDAQELHHQSALEEIQHGKKRSHWMWFVFPQIKGLGFSQTSIFYAIENLNEAGEYLSHAVLGGRLILVCNELVKLESNDAHKIFGSPDDLKLKSSMTLFASLEKTDPVFESVLKKFFNGLKDQKTLQIISKVA